MFCVYLPKIGGEAFNFFMSDNAESEDLRLRGAATGGGGGGGGAASAEVSPSELLEVDAGSAADLGSTVAGS